MARGLETWGRRFARFCQAIPAPAYRLRMPTMYGVGPVGHLVWACAFDDFVHRQDIRRALKLDDEHTDVEPTAEFVLSAAGVDHPVLPPEPLARNARLKASLVARGGIVPFSRDTRLDLGEERTPPRSPYTLRSAPGDSMGIGQSKRRVAAARMAKAAQELLEASTLCSIATIAPDGSAYVNTAYFAWSPELDVVWMSEPHAQHSQNILERATAAIAVYDSTQSWGNPDRGVQLFGSAHEVDESEASDFEAVYASRFSNYQRSEFGAYRFYAFHPRRIKLFDERELGAGRFVTARVEDTGRLSWESTQVYRANF